jgi:hypothetical protein
MPSDIAYPGRQQINLHFGPWHAVRPTSFLLLVPFLMPLPSGPVLWAWANCKGVRPLRQQPFPLPRPITHIVPHDLYRSLPSVATEDQVYCRSQLLRAPALHHRCSRPRSISACTATVATTVTRLIHSVTSNDPLRTHPLPLWSKG